MGVLLDDLCHTSCETTPGTELCLSRDPVPAVPDSHALTTAKQYEGNWDCVQILIHLRVMTHDCEMAGGGRTVGGLAIGMRLCGIQYQRKRARVLVGLFG